MDKTYSSVPSRLERTQETPCPLCGSTAASPLFSDPGFSFVRCRSCSLAYQSPQPIPDDLRKRYDSRYFSYELSNEEAFFTLIRLGLRDIGFARIASDFPHPRKFLDIGCATGRLLQEMKAEGWEALGVDLCRESAEWGAKSRGVRILAGTLDEARLPAASIHVAHLSHLIEHVPDPRGLLAEVRRILAPRGVAVITTPNIDGLQARLFGARWRSAIADHLTLFGKATLRRLLEESGFSVEKTVTWGGIAKGAAPLLVKRPLDRLAKLLGFGDVMLFLARR